MNKVSSIGSLLKKIYRIYTSILVQKLEERGFSDLRASFLDILLYICENNTTSIKQIGIACGLKKQTMTSHLNELEERGYIIRVTSKEDRRAQSVTLTEYGERFKLNLLEAVSELETLYSSKLGEVEIDRLQFVLKNFYDKIS